MNIQSLEKMMEKAYSVKVKGALIAFMATVLRDRQIALAMTKEQLDEMEGVNDRHYKELAEREKANEAAGCAVLQMMEDALGREFMEMFVEGTFDEIISTETKRSALN